MLQLTGIIPPLVTPMNADESLDLPGLGRHIDYLLGCRVHGLFVLGTTGEFYALDDAEKQAVVAAAVEHAGGRSPVYVGTGAESTREAIRHTKMAEREGAQGVSVITPYFIRPSQAELFEHYRRIAESTSLPVILYSNPGTCGGLAIEPATAVKLAAIPNIVGIKDSSGDLQNALEIMQSVPKGFSVLMGRDTLILAALQNGASGAIPATCNIAPELCVGIYEAFQRGDLAEAKSCQDRLHSVRTAFSLGGGVIKDAMALRGWNAGPTRRPLAPLDAASRGKLQAVLAAAGLMN